MSFKTYDEFSLATSSEKIVLAHLEAVCRLMNFEVHGAIFKKKVPNFVIGLTDGVTETPMDQVGSIALVTDATKFFYDPASSYLYIFAYNHQASEYIVTYRYFFSSASIELPSDLQEGFVVPYEPRLTGFPNFVSQYAQGKKSISLTGSGTLELVNADGHFNEIFDKVVWENKPVVIYSTHRDLPPSEAKLIFRGYVTSKAFKSDSISFSVKDEIFSLNQEVPLGLIEGREESANRWIYGKADNVKIQTIDPVGDGRALTGTISGIYGSTTINGEGTFFLSELTENDIVTQNGVEFTVEQVVTDTVFVATEQSLLNFNDVQATVMPEYAHYTNNRQFKVCGHELFAPSTTITRTNGKNRFEVADIYGISNDDWIEVNGYLRQIRRVSYNKDHILNSVILRTNIPVLPAIGDVMNRAPVRNLRYKVDGKEYTITNQAISFTNDSNGVYLEISPTAEKDIAPTKILKQTLTFVAGSRHIWYGAPTIRHLTLVPVNRVVDPITTVVYLDIWNKWFALTDEEGKRAVFWFSDGTSQPPQEIRDVANAVQGSQLIEVPVTIITTVVGQVLTAAELGTILMNRLSEANFYEYEQVGSYIRMSSSNIKDAIQTTVISGTTVVTGTNPIVPGILLGSTSFTQQTIAIGVKVLNQNVKLTNLLKPRDYVRPFTSSSEDLYEVLTVDDNKITIRTNLLAETNFIDQLYYKTVDYIQDATEVYIDVVSGKMDENGGFIDTHPKIVRDIIRSIGLSSYVDEETFARSSKRSSYLPSLCIPLTAGAPRPQAKTIIEFCNKSILGSLHLTDALKLGYDVYDGAVQTDLTINEDDCVSWSSEGDATDLFLKTEVRYRFMDVGAVDYLFSSYESKFARKYVNSTFTQAKNYYLYEEDHALEIAQRDAFINSASSTTIKIKSDIRFTNVPIGTRVILNLAGFFIPYGANTSLARTGVITKKTISGNTVSLEISDFGAILLRTAKITADDAPNWQNTPEDLRPKSGFIVDDNGIVGTDSYMDGTQLIS